MSFSPASSERAGGKLDRSSIARSPRHILLLKERMTEKNGGARRSRTDDILLAKQALYQLSYGPSPFGEQPGPIGNLSFSRRLVKVVGPIRFELMTSRLSSVRSNQLSYGPKGVKHRHTNSSLGLWCTLNLQPKQTSGGLICVWKEKRRRRHPAYIRCFKSII